jgi:hypothetical protein
MSDEIVWNFHESLGRAGLGIVSDAGLDLGKKGEARLERALDQLRQMPKTSWTRPKASSLGNHIYVIRFKDAAQVQRRLFGHFHDPHCAFVMTLLGYEKDDAYHPADYKEKSQQSRLVCIQDFGRKTQPYREHCSLCRPREQGALPAAGARTGQTSLEQESPLVRS